MKRLLIPVVCLLISIHANTQNVLFQQEITLPLELGSKATAFEFSGLARWDDKILLIPTLKKPTKEFKLYAVPEKDISGRLDNAAAKISYTTIEIDSNSFKAQVSNILDYDGIEAAVVVGPHIFFSVEVDASKGAKLSRISKGYFDLSGNGKTIIRMIDHIDIDRSRVSAMGEKSSDNAGFESLAYLPGENKLITFFEERDKWGRHPFYKIDMDLKKSSLFLLNDSREDRLADVCLDRQKLLYGISSRFETPDFARAVIVIIDIEKHTMKEVGELCVNACPDNWEGIIRFQNGFLLISDNKNSRGETGISKLIYCALPE